MSSAYWFVSFTYLIINKNIVALRILCICFETRMSLEWPRIVRVMRDLGRRNEAAPELWSFLEFVVTHRTPLYIVLMPFILHKVWDAAIGEHFVR